MDLEKIKEKLEEIIHGVEMEVKELLGYEFDARVEAVFSVDDCLTSKGTSDVVFAITGTVKVGEHKQVPEEVITK